MTRGRTNHGRDDWETPRDFFEEVTRFFNFTLDAAASAENTLCKHYYTEADAGDICPNSWGNAPKWHLRTWCNPPYSLKRIFVAQAWGCALDGLTTCMLLPASSDTRWFHSALLGCSQAALVKGRLQFTLNGERPRRLCKKTGKLVSSGNGGGSALFVFGEPLLGESDRWAIIKGGRA